SEISAWAAKFFEAQSVPLMPITDVIAYLSSADDVPKDIRDAASSWKETGKRPHSPRPGGPADWIEKTYDSYQAMCTQHEGILKQLPELRDRSLSSLTAYIRAIESSTLPNRYQDFAESANKLLPQLNPKTFIDDVLLLPQGAKLQKLAEEI